MSAIDPRFYIVHVIYFTLGSILFGFFLGGLRKEVLQNGWALAPRCVWLSCLCCSSFGYVIIQIDPVGAMGIFSDPWQLFLGQVDASLLVGSVCASIYMYVLIGFKSESIPLLVTRIWIASNVGALFVLFVFALLGAILNSNFWFILCVLVILSQEAFLYLGLTITVCKTTQLLNSLAPMTDYRAQIQKIWLVLVFATLVIAAAVTNQATGLTSPEKAWDVPVPVTHLETFQFKLILSDLTTLIAHMILLFMVRPPPPPQRESTSQRPIRMTHGVLSRLSSKSSLHV